MFIGHYGLALGAKSAAPRASLGTLILAAQWLDLIWPIFVLLGLERVEISPGNTAMTPLAFVSYPLSHSLLAAMGWATLLAGVYKLARPRAEAASWIWALVLSHWVLDALAHRADLPLYPGSSMLIGLGLWNSRPATVIVEGVLFVAGTLLYQQSTRPRNGIGTYGFRALIAFLVLAYLIMLVGPPPATSRDVAIVGLGQWLLVLWGYGVDRNRVPLFAARLGDGY